MIELIGPERFKEVPWKNGKGSTTQLAINAGGSLAEFDWRISMARVVEDGPFSSFPGIWRNLALLEGNGLWLSHDQGPEAPLVDVLGVASFDGAADTRARLVDGPILDFNLMCRRARYRAVMQSRVEEGLLYLKDFELGFAYSPTAELVAKSRAGSVEHRLPAGHLLQLTDADSADLEVSGRAMLVMGLYPG